MSETQPELTTNSYVFQEQPGLRSSVAEAAAILRTAAMTPGHRQPTQSSCCCGFLSLTFLQPMLTKVLENPHLSKTHSLNPQPGLRAPGHRPQQRLWQPQPQTCPLISMSGTSCHCQKVFLASQSTLYPQTPLVTLHEPLLPSPSPRDPSALGWSWLSTWICSSPGAFLNCQRSLSAEVIC